MSRSFHRQLSYYYSFDLAYFCLVCSLNCCYSQLLQAIFLSDKSNCFLLRNNSWVHLKFIFGCNQSHSELLIANWRIPPCFRDVNQQQQSVVKELEGLHHQALALHINLVQGLHTIRAQHPPPFQALDPPPTSLLVGIILLVVLKAAHLSHGWRIFPRVRQLLHPPSSHSFIISTSMVAPLVHQWHLHPAPLLAHLASKPTGNTQVFSHHGLGQTMHLCPTPNHQALGTRLLQTQHG